jgi:hemoglobin
MRNMFGTVLLLSLLTGCQTTPTGSLYEALGKDEGIERLVREVTQLAHEDERIAFLFEETEDEFFIMTLSEQICDISGGPCTYQGLNMREAHSGMGITHAEFNYFVEDLEIAMDNVGLSTSAQNRLLDLLVPMFEDVIHQ